MEDESQLMPSADEPMSRKVRVMFSVSLFLGYIAFGIGSSLAAPALLDIASLVYSTFDAVSYGLVLRSIGYGSGGVIIGWMYGHWINRQVGCTLCLVLSGLSLLSIPFLTSLWSYVLMEGVYGFFTGGIDCASNAWILELWPKSSSPFMQALHFFFAVGMVVAPLIDEPFLAPLNQTNGTDNHWLANSILRHPVILSDEAEPSDGNPRIMIPFIVGSAGFFLVAILQTILWFCVKYQPPKRLEKEDDSDTSSDTRLTSDESRSKKHTVLAVGLAMMLFVSYAITEMNVFTFIAGYAVYCDLKLSKSTGAFMNSVASAAFAVSRGISAFAAAKVSPQFMLYTSVAMIVVGNLVLVFLGNHSVTALWVVVVILGSGHSSIIGGFYSFLEERIEMTSFVCGFCMFACCIGQLISPLVVGNLLKSHPSVFGFLNMGGIGVVVLLLALFLLLDRIMGKKKAADHDTNHVN